VNYGDEVPFGEKMFDQLADTYRRIRNTLRILLGNLYDFQSDTDRTTDLTLVDRWILSRLQQLVRTCKEAYHTYEFHKVYHAINQFCAVDLSSLYIDVTKDRMYCDGAQSPRRRATQSAMHEIFDTLVRLVAPILAFTADEAWGYFGKTASVHLESFPDFYAGRVDQNAADDVEALLQVRSVVAQSIETARQQKLIGNTLEAHVELNLPKDHRVNQLPLADVEEFLILSDLQITNTDAAPSATVTKTSYKRCERCWRHRPAVGTISDYSELCDRCAEVVAEMSVKE
jgi:isoleucyl-tRNA synthetase